MYVCPEVHLFQSARKTVEHLITLRIHLVTLCVSKLVQIRRRSSTAGFRKRSVLYHAESFAAWLELKS